MVTSNPRRSSSARQVDAGYQAVPCHNIQLPTTELPPALWVTWRSPTRPGRRRVPLAYICVPPGWFGYPTGWGAPATGPAPMV